MSDILVTAGGRRRTRWGATNSGPAANGLFFSGSADRTLQSPFRLSTQGAPSKECREAGGSPERPAPDRARQFDEDDRIDIAALSMQERGVDATLLVDYFAC
jgi:hypothetical protein